MNENKKRKRDDLRYLIFINFEDILIDSKLTKDINKDNFVDICYESIDNYNNILNTLKKLKSTGNFLFYVFSKDYPEEQINLIG